MNSLAFYSILVLCLLVDLFIFKLIDTVKKNNNICIFIHSEVLQPTNNKWTRITQPENRVLQLVLILPTQSYYNRINPEIK